MNNQSLIFSAFILLFIVGCANTSEKKVTIDEPEKEQLKDSIDGKLHLLDTIKTTYPIQIGNDPALITVKKIIGSTKNHFIIDLDYRNEKAFSIYTNKFALIDSTQAPFFQDSLLLDYTQGSSLTSVKYQAIRGSTLCFSAILENAVQQKTVEGRFNVFYDPERRGQFYGWITDTVYDRVSIK